MDSERLEILFPEGSGGRSQQTRSLPVSTRTARTQGSHQRDRGKHLRFRSEKPEARLFKKSLKGACLECTVAALFHDVGENGIGHVLPKNFNPESLRLPHLQSQFARMMDVGNSEADFSEIDWDEVIANWHLEFSASQKVSRRHGKRLF